MRYLAPLVLVCLSTAAAEAPWPIDGRSVSTPEEQSMDSALLEGADAFIRAQSPSRSSFLVIRNGYLVFERYYGGNNAESRNPVAFDHQECGVGADGDCG